MKKLLFILPLFILSCCSPYNQIAIYKTNNIDNSIQEKEHCILTSTFTEIQNKIDSKTSFLLYIYSETCSSCLTKTAYVCEYAKTTESLIYCMTSESQDYVNLQHTYDDIFPSTFMPPLLYIFNNGKYEQLQTDRFTSFENTKNYLNQYQKSSKINYFSLKDSFESKVEINENYLLLNLETKVEYTFYNNYIYNLASASDKPTFIFSYSSLESSLISKLLEKFLTVESFTNKIILIQNDTYQVGDYLNQKDYTINLVNQYYQS